MAETDRWKAREKMHSYSIAISQLSQYIYNIYIYTYHISPILNAFIIDAYNRCMLHIPILSYFAWEIWDRDVDVKASASAESC